MQVDRSYVLALSIHMRFFVGISRQETYYKYWADILGQYRLFALLASI
jgi:hypothetical protein